MSYKIQPRDGLTILRRKQVEARTGLSRSTIYKFVALGSFPKPLNLGSTRAVGWLEEEVMSWVAKQAESRIKSNRPDASK